MSGAHIPPTTLKLLTDIPKSCRKDDKIRFLGCIRNYNPLTCILTLYTPLSSSPLNRIQIHTNIRAPLPSLPMGSLDDGAYVHIVGYVQSVNEEKGTAEVDAVKVWEAGEVDMKLWEETVKGREEVGGLVGMVVEEAGRRGGEVWRRRGE